jgi:dihydropyrimidinase
LTGYSPSAMRRAPDDWSPLSALPGPAMDGSLLITNGTVVTATNMYQADVLVRQDVITAIGTGKEWRAERTIDATGRYILPGGVDVHTHMNYPVAGFTAVTEDDFTSGTVAAAFGGTTCIIDFSKTRPGEDVYDAYARRTEEAAQGAVIDYAVHAIVPPNAGAREFAALTRLAGEGATSWKFFMCYRGLATDDETILSGFRLCASLGVLPLVHAERDAILTKALSRLRKSGHLGVRAHLDAHPADAEDAAVARAIELADEANVPLYIVHVSSAGALEHIGAARDRGQPVLAETCPQYLARSFEDYSQADDATAAGHICSPPIRERAHQDALWSALRDGVLSTVASDHACFCLEPGPANVRPYKHHASFEDVPNGVPGVEERMRVVWGLGVLPGRIDPSRFVDVTATSPAKLLGLYPKKGSLEVGADADLVIWGPDAPDRIGAEQLHSRAGYTLYEGLKVGTGPETVISRGDVIIDHGTLQAEPGRGQYVDRHCDVVRSA